MEFLKATKPDIVSVGKLYDAICDYLADHINYPHWEKGIYPTIADAKKAFEENALYVAKDGDSIIGTIILKHQPEPGYEKAVWLAENDYDKIYVLYKLAVHPDYLGKGVGKLLLAGAEQIARDEGCCSLRLDVVKDNVPAEHLYRQCGYQYIDTVSLGLEAYGIPWFNLYEKVIESGI